MFPSPASVPLILRLLLAVLFILPLLADAQVTEEELRKRELFLRSREQMRTVPATPRPRPAATPVPAPRSTPEPGSAPKAIPVAQPGETPPPLAEESSKEPTEEPSKEPPTEPAPTDPELAPPPPLPPVPLPSERDSTPEPTATPEPEPTPTPTPTPPPTKRAIVVQQPTPRPTKAPKREAADVTVEKSGRDREEGVVSSSFSLFGPRWKYVTGKVKSAIDNASVRRNRWKYIIVHNSATRQGNAKIFERYHRNVRKMRNGMAYHFVIGNGTSTGDGQIEVGNRWVRQINGGHVASNYLNNIAIGICLVGDFDRDTPTKRQRESLDELIRYLRRRVGRIDGKQSIVRGHRELNPRPTSCPGRRFPLDWLRRTFD